MRAAALIVGLVIGLLAGNANAAIIEILCTSSEPCGKFTGTTADGTVFTADPDPTNPSTGTGVFQPFLRTQESTGGNGLENGFNTDAGEPGINFDTKNGSSWTRSVTLSEFETVVVGGTAFFELQLDANQNMPPHSVGNQITITELQIFIGNDPNLADPEATNTGINGTGYAGTLFDNVPGTDNQLLGLAPVWNLDSAVNGDVSVVLQASICNTPGQCGSGKGDLSVLIPTSLLGTFSPTDNFVLYTEYTGANDGFEEWRFRDTPTTQVSEPGTLVLFTVGLIGLGVFARRRGRARSS